MPEMPEDFLEQPGPAGVHLAGDERGDAQPGEPAHAAAAAQQFPPQVFQARVAPSLEQPGGFRPADFIDSLIQVHGDMESIEHVQRLAGLLGHDVEVRLPHVAAHEAQPGDDLRGPRP